MRTKVYRLEHEKTKIGPYVALSSNRRLLEMFDEITEEVQFLVYLFRKNCFDSVDHPSAEDDVKGFHHGMLTATESLESLFDWIGGVNPMRWPDFGFQIVEIEVYEQYVRKGKKQVAYHEENELSRKVIPLTRELWVEHR